MDALLLGERAELGDRQRLKLLLFDRGIFVRVYVRLS